MNWSKPDLKVADVMRTAFRSCNASTTIPEAAAALRLSGGPALPVTRAQVPVGTLTEAGLAAALAEHGGDLSRLTAEAIMERPAETACIDAPADEALRRLDHASCVLAVDRDGLLKGVVTLVEVAPHLSEAAFGRVAARIQERLGPPPVEEARADDPSAEVESSKSQAQPHPWDSPTREHPAPVPLVSPSDLINPMLRARDVMTADPRTCSPESTVLEAAAIFRDADCGIVPVVEAGRPVGVLTDRDAILALPEREFDLARTPVGELMARDPVTVEPDATLKVVLDRLADGVRRVLVVDAGRLVGVVSWTDLVPHLSERGLGWAVARIVGEGSAGTG